MGGLKLKAIIERETFLPIFAKVAQAVPNRTTIDAWFKVRMSCENGVAIIHANSGDLIVSAKPPGVAIEREGACLIPPKEFMQILRDSTADQVGLEIVGDALVITSGRDEFKLNLHRDTGEFGKPPEFSAGSYVSMQGEALSHALRSASACAGEEGRFANNAICVSLHASFLSCVGSDGAAISQNFAPVTAIVREPFTRWALVSPRGAKQIISIASAGDCLLAADSSRVYFQQGIYAVASSLLAGTYTDYVKGFERVRAAMTNPIEVEIPCEEFRSAVRRARVSCGPDSSGIDFNWTTGELTLTAAAERGASSVKLPVAYLDDPVKLRMPGDRLLSALSLVPDTDVLKITFMNNDVSVFFESGMFLALTGTMDLV